MAVKIQHPKRRTVIRRANFVAFGSALRSDGMLIGILRNDKGDVVAYGKTLREPTDDRLNATDTPGKKPSRGRWLVFFRDVPPTGAGSTYTLHIVDSKNNIKDAAPNITVVVGGAYPPIEIAFPAASTDHCNESFFAYGNRDAAETPLSAKVTIDYPTGAQTPADYLYEDPDTGFWTAIFPVLPANPDAGDRYRLDVDGSNAGNANVDDLDIRNAYC